MHSVPIYCLGSMAHVHLQWDNENPEVHGSSKVNSCFSLVFIKKLIND